MKKGCPSGKKLFESESLALEALYDVWSRTEFQKGEGPISVYTCEDCGHFHFTSKGTFHPKLEEFLKENNLRISREAERWIRKMR
ncbi:MAG: hypothetical protein FJZ78_10770 [Bacteroidetes bacterium]|nr:hypothetical protein [Bacteroidota bacterium]